METKACTGCHQTFLLTAYGKNRGRPSGLSDYCRPCARHIQITAYRKRQAASLALDPVETWERKPCESCHHMQPAAQFAVDRRRTGNLAAVCSECEYRRSVLPNPPPLTHKVCSDCRELLERNRFARNTNGLNRRCRTCVEAMLVPATTVPCAICEREEHLRGGLCRDCRHATGTLNSLERLERARRHLLGYLPVA